MRSMIKILDDKTDSTEFHEVLAWLKEKDKYIYWLKAETDAEGKIILEQCMQHLLTVFGNSCQDGFFGVKNMLRTAQIINQLPGVNRLIRLFEGVPAILALTGPSLNKQLPYLKEIQDKACIICPDVSLPILEANGITPHFVCRSERVNMITSSLKGKHRSYLVTLPVCGSDNYSVYDGPKFIAYRKLCQFDWLPFKRGILPSPGTVGNMCGDLARLLGCSPIILIGADHAFPADGASHASGVNGEIWRAPNTSVIEGMNGEALNTDYNFVCAAREWERQALQSTIYNCTEGGALIRNCINKPFREVALDKTYNLWPKIEAACKFTPEKVDWEDVFKQTLIGLDEIDQINSIIETQKHPLYQMLIYQIMQPYHLMWCMDRNISWTKEDVVEWLTVARGIGGLLRDEITGILRGASDGSISNTIKDAC